jgi:hypothetical protein
MEYEPLKIPDIFIDAPLYRLYQFENQGHFAKFINYSSKIDTFCKECGCESIFAFSGQRESPSNALNVQYFGFTLFCKRVEQHKIVLVYRVFDQNYVMKIGQYPSLADMSGGELNRYSKELEKNALADLRRAVGLASHGIGIGAFVYLRRVFEGLIDKAHEEAQNSDTWDEGSYKSIYMNDKIILLKQYLPDFLVHNSGIYGILSKGIHELGEDECINAFPIIYNGILLILDEKIAERERKKRQTEITRGLQQLQEKCKATNGKKNGE